MTLSACYINLYTLRCLIAALAQITLSSYTSLPTTSSCALIDIPAGVEVGGTAEFTGDATDGSLNALAIDLDDIKSVLAITRTQLNVTVSYSGYPTVGEQSITAIDWSTASDCSLLSEATLSIQAVVSDANFSVAATAFTRDYIVITVYVIGGTDAQVDIDLGDGSLSVPICEVSASLSVLTYNISYQNEGTFEITVAAYNLVSNVTKTDTIEVYERIADLVLSGDSSVLTPPGSGTWRVEAGADQYPVKNITCVWNMGANYEDTSNEVALLDSSTPHEITFSYALEEDVGIQAINVNCSNALSSQNLTMDVTVIWDNVTLGELSCPSSTLWNHPITCELTIVRFGTGACFEWDMGDGNPFVYYRDGNCADYVRTASPTYVQVILPKSYCVKLRPSDELPRTSS